MGAEESSQFEDEILWGNIHTRGDYQLGQECQAGIIMVCTARS